MFKTSQKYSNIIVSLSSYVMTTILLKRLLVQSATIFITLPTLKYLVCLLCVHFRLIAPCFPTLHSLIDTFLTN